MIEDQYSTYRLNHQKLLAFLLERFPQAKGINVTVSSCDADRSCFALLMNEKSRFHRMAIITD